MTAKKNDLDSVRERVLQIMREEIAAGTVKNESVFAKEIGTTSAAISRWKAGENAYPTVLNIITCCRKYNRSANWVLLESGSERLSGKDSTESIQKRMDKLETMYSKLSPRSKSAT
jgi:hypothetical protein